MKKRGYPDAPDVRPRKGLWDNAAKKAQHPFSLLPGTTDFDVNCLSPKGEFWHRLEHGASFNSEKHPCK